MVLLQCFTLKAEQNITESSKIANKMAKVPVFSKMDPNSMKANGEMANKKVKALSSLRMETSSTKVNSKKTK